MKRYADHEFTAEAHATILALATQLEAVIAEYPGEDAKHVRRIAKIGRKSEGFAREALDAAKSNADLIPRGLDVDRFERALKQRDLLRTQLLQLSLLTEKVRTAMTLLGVDVYAYGLDVYSALKRGKTPEVRATVQTLSRCFERKRKKKKTEENEREAGAVSGAGAEAPTTPTPTPAASAIPTPPSREASGERAPVRPTGTPPPDGAISTDESQEQAPTSPTQSPHAPILPASQWTNRADSRLRTTPGGEASTSGSGRISEE